jgi:hypothetical protein
MSGALVRIAASMTMAPCLFTRHARRCQIHCLRIRAAAGGDQQLVGGELALPGHEHESAVPISHLTRLRMFQHLDPFGAEGIGDGRTDGRVLTEEQRTARQDRDPAAQPGESLRQFDGHHRRADHCQPLRERVARQRLGRGPVRRVLQAGDRRDRRTRAGRDQAAVETHFACAAVCSRHGQRARVLEPGLARQPRDGWIAVQDAFVLGAAQFLDARLLLGKQPLAQDGRRCCRDAVVERARRAQMSDVRGADHDLGRHAADIDAGAAEGAAFDERHPRALLDGLERRGHRRAARCR